MTSPTPTPEPTPAPTDGSVIPPAPVSTVLTIGTVEPEAVQALQIGLAAAHAAIWTYGLISAYDPEDSGTIRANRIANTQIRDSTIDLLVSTGAQPVSTEVAYSVPVPISDRATALQVAMLVEKDATNAWRAVIGSTDNYALRKFALIALSGAAVRLTQWRSIAGVVPVTVPFPGAEV